MGRKYPPTAWWLGTVDALLGVDARDSTLESNLGGVP